MAKKKDVKEFNINVLGTDYSVKLTNEEKDPELKGINGYCMTLDKRIAVDDKPNNLTADSVTKRTLRHEILHAYFYESGLDNEAPWSDNEELLVDWIALQFPKIMKTMQEVGAL